MVASFTPGLQTSMRSLRHPGPVSPEREKVAACRAHELTLQLKAGQSVNAAVTGALAEAGFASGYVHLEGVRVAPMRYVIPAPAPDAAHVAWYSDTRAPDGVVTIVQAGVIAGERDGEPFIHCHGIWRHADGTERAGHLLPHEAFVAQDVEVQGWGLDGAAYIADDDAETNFKLFAAEAVAPNNAGSAAPRALACTLKPNGDISTAIEAVCRENGFAAATVYGVGSLVGVDFTDGRHVPSYATEVFITNGAVTNVDGEPRCTLDVALVGLDGAIHQGRLQRGSNPVCVTFELLIVET